MLLQALFDDPVTYFFCTALAGILCIILAKAKNRSATLWFFLSIPFGLLTLFILLLIKPGEAEPGKEDEGAG